MFGESVLNDAVAIVLFRTFLREYQENESFTAGTLPSTLWSFFTITIESTSVGVLIGLACSFLFKHTRIRDYPKFEISLLFLSSYGSYAFAEAVELSGIMSIFFTGVVLATYNTYNLSPTSQVCTRFFCDYYSVCGVSGVLGCVLSIDRVYPSAFWGGFLAAACWFVPHLRASPLPPPP